MTLKMTTLQKTVGKGENAGVPAFSPFPTVFSTLSKREIIIRGTYDLSSANTFNLVLSKNLSFGKELTEINDMVAQSLEPDQADITLHSSQHRLID